MVHPRPHPAQARRRLLFVLGDPADGPETAEVRRLARALDPARWQIDLVPCAAEGVPDGVVAALEGAGVLLDLSAIGAEAEATVRHLVRRLAGCDAVVAGQGVPALDAALDAMHLHPPLIERGRLGVPSPRAARHFALTEAARAAAASRMPGRGADAVAVPRLLDTGAPDPAARALARAHWGVGSGEIVVGWVGPRDGLDAAKRALGRSHPFRFVPLDAPLTGAPDEGGWLPGLDVLVSLTTGDAALHGVAEAGAARLAVVAVAGVEEGRTGLLVPRGDAAAVVGALLRLAADPALRAHLGTLLHARLDAAASAAVLAPRWEALVEGVIAARSVRPATVFRSFVQGGFECSTHRLRSGKRLDVIAATGHDRRAEADYRQLGGMGLGTLRDGVRWHLVERQPGRHDLSSFRPMVAAAARAGSQVIWDLMHYGWPDDLDIWSPAFVDRFAGFARATALALREGTDAVPFWCPVNEISFMSWGGGDVGYLNPFGIGRGFELKVQLARAAIAAMHALRDVDPRARFVHCEPLIAIHHDPATGHPRAEAEGLHEAQYQALDLLAGRIWPQIGGDPSFVDIVGVNYYVNNQWVHGGRPIDVDHPAYRPLSDLLFEVFARYGRPVVLSETGIEADRRAPWFRHVTSEVARARARGVPVEGVCLYPVMNHPGWDDDRDCPNGLLTQAVEGAVRGVDPALAAAVAEAVAAFPPSRGNNPRPQAFMQKGPARRVENARVFP